MTPQVFRDTTIQAVVSRVKEEFGADAMILTTRRVPRSPRDPYGEDLFEILAVPKESDPKSNPATRKYANSKDVVDKGSINKKYGVKKSGNFDSNFDNRSNDLGSIWNELAGLKDLITLAGFGRGIQTVMANHPDATQLFASLLKCGISDSLAHSLLKDADRELSEAVRRDTKVRGTLKKYVIKACMAMLSTNDPFRTESGDGMPHVAAFVGPTGVGKTTTVAKLAAELSLNRKLKVGLISIDNYRIGALEQLKTYGAIMGLPCIPAFNKEDLGRALNRMRALDVVLVDTAGHSHWDEDKMAEATTLLKKEIRVSIHLVLSMTTGRGVMKEAARAFSSLKPETYVFTKIDESRQCGKILDQVQDLALPVSMVTNGQRVPEDLMIPNIRELVGIVLGTEQEGER